MKTKQKKDESKLYDFDYESKEEKKLKAKRKKAVKKSASKEAKKEANGKHGQVPEKKRYEDEIIIGVTRYPEKKQTNNQKSTKKFNKKPQKRRKNEENREKYNVGQINKKSKIQDDKYYIQQDEEYNHKNNKKIKKDLPFLLKLITI